MCSHFLLACFWSRFKEVRVLTWNWGSCCWCSSPALAPSGSTKALSYWWGLRCWESGREAVHLYEKKHKPCPMLHNLEDEADFVTVALRQHTEQWKHLLYVSVQPCSRTNRPDGASWNSASLAHSKVPLLPQHSSCRIALKHTPSALPTAVMGQPDKQPPKELAGRKRERCCCIWSGRAVIRLSLPQGSLQQCAVMLRLARAQVLTSSQE